jgi:curved DNA-binding protein
VLGNAEKKSQYDMRGDSMFNKGTGQGFHQYHRSSGMDIDEMLRNMFGGGAGGSSFSFGGGSPFETPRPQANLDIHVDVAIPLETAVNGDYITTEINGENIKLTIPAGIKNGTKMRVSGKGRSMNGRVGNVYITIKITPPNNMTIENNDIFIMETIDLKTAIFGGQKEINFFGDVFKIKVPQNTKHGQKMRVKKGLSDGVLYVVLNITLPTAEERPDLENVL